MTNAGKMYPIKLSIVIPTYNRSDILAGTIRDVLKQNYKDYEFLIVDQSAPEEAAKNEAYVKHSGDNRLHYLHLKSSGLPNARNEGLKRIKGEIVLFLDDDVIILSNKFLDAHLAAFDDTRIGGVTGRHVERSVVMNSRRTACYVSWSGRTIFNLFGHERQMIGSCKGSNMSFRTAVLEKVGGFDRKTHMLEDTDFSVRVAKAGWKLLFEPAAEVIHLSTNAGGVRAKTAIETEYRRFSSTAYYILKHRGVFGCIPFLATFSLIAFSRISRYRSLKILPGYIKALKHGFSMARAGPDQTI